MAAGSVMLPPSLLPWRQGGVDYLLAADDLPPELSLCHEQRAAPPRVAPARTAPRPAPSPAAPSSPSGAAASSFAAHRAAVRKQAENARRRSPSGTGTPGATVAGAAPKPVPPSPPQRLLAPDHWPRLWQERLAATPPAPVLWTYWALGEDLYGTPDPARRDILRRMLADLGHPAGTHCFWPAALPPSRGQATLEANAPVFWSGVDMLKARVLIVMGVSAVTALELPARLQPFHQTRHNGRLVIALRDLDDIAREPRHYDAVREFLRQALAPFGRR